MLKSRSSLTRWLGYLIIGLCLWLRWPVLSTGFTVDDFAQLAMMRGDYPVPRAPLSLFTFSDGSTAENERLKAVGFFPWWSHPELRVSLLRPLASALMWLDFKLFERNAMLYHLHSALWWIAMLLALLRLNREILDDTSALVALALFSLHPGHNLLLGWIANRNAIVATTFALIGLTFQLRASGKSVKRNLVAALLCYLIAIASSEYAIGYFVYGAMISAVRAPTTLARGLRICTWTACAVGYVLLRGALGYGTRGSGMYIDPLREPIAFLEAAVQRFPVLVGDAVLALRSTWWSGGFPWAGAFFQAGWVRREDAMDLTYFRDVQVGFGLGACLIAALVARTALRTAAFRERTTALAFALALPLAFVPALASLPESRLMLPALIGWTALVSGALVRTWKTACAQRTRGKWASLAALACVVSIEGFAPLIYAVDELHELPQAAGAIRRSMITPTIDRIVSKGKIVLLAAAADPTTTIYVPLVRTWYGHGGPDSCQLLMGGYGPQRLTRVDQNQFLLERLEHAFTTFDVYASAFNRGPIEYGQHFRAGALDVEVLRTDRGRPMVARYTLDRALDSPEVVLLSQTEKGLVPVSFPQVGENVVIPAAALPGDNSEPGTLE